MALPRAGCGFASVLALPWVWLVLFLVAPLCIVVAIALSVPREAVPPYALGFEPANVILVATDPLYRGALLLSLRVAGLTTLLCLMLGYPMALGIARCPERWRSALLVAAILPFWTGLLPRINAWIGLLADDSFLAWGPIQLLYTDTAMVLGMVHAYLPFMVLPLYARLATLDPVHPEAAADLGASPIAVFLRVTLPLSLPGVAAGCALVFIPAAGEYVIPDLLGGPDAGTIGRVLRDEFFNNRDWPVASAVAVWLLVLLIVAPATVFGVVRGWWGGGAQNQNDTRIPEETGYNRENT